MTASELRAITNAGGLVWSASPVRFVTEDGHPVTVLEHRVSQTSEVTDAGANRLTGPPVLTLVVRVHAQAKEPVEHALADELGDELGDAEPAVAGRVAEQAVEVVG